MIALGDLSVLLQCHSRTLYKFQPHDTAQVERLELAGLVSRGDPYNPLMFMLTDDGKSLANTLRRAADNYADAVQSSTTRLTSSR